MSLRSLLLWAPFLICYNLVMSTNLFGFDATEIALSKVSIVPTEFSSDDSLLEFSNLVGIKVEW